LPRGDEDAYKRASWEAIEECEQLNPPYNPTDWIGEERERWFAKPSSTGCTSSGDIS
jgi:hypothetical protein